jgi:hypothetical protein
MASIFRVEEYANQQTSMNQEVSIVSGRLTISGIHDITPRKTVFFTPYLYKCILCFVFCSRNSRPFGVRYTENMGDNKTYLLTYLLMYGAETFLRSCQLCSHSGNSQQF